MRSEYIQVIETEVITEELPPERDTFGVSLKNWFIDAGIAPDGRYWVAPSDEFYKQWLLNYALKARINELGFDWAFDSMGYEFIFYCPFGRKE